jgi:3-deoxy-manno-octulosonate cytidylyltransferase (CMP-KDO synthetase)
VKIVIPARYGSTRLPGKVLLPIAGKPMIQWVYESACKADAEEIIIATDDQRVAEVAREFGASVCITSDQHQSGTDRLAEVASIESWADDEIVVNLQADEPLMPADLVAQVASTLAAHPKAAVSTLAHKLETRNQFDDPNIVKVVMDCNGFALYFSRAAIPYKRDENYWQSGDLANNSCIGYRHIGLYAYRAGFLKEYVGWTQCNLEQDEMLEQLRVLWNGYKIFVSLAEQEPPHGIDTADDLAAVEALVRNRAGQ